MIDEEKQETTPLERQIGGTHYKNFAIQPVEFTTKNKLGFLVGCVIKRVCRYNQPGGKSVQDINKAIHELELLKEIELSESERPIRPIISQPTP